MERKPVQTLLVSILTMGRPQNIDRLLENLPPWFAEFSCAAGVAIHMVIRNNAPNVSFQETSEKIEQVHRRFPELRITLVTGEPNVGFGRGHNANFLLSPSDAMLLLNDDIGLPHIEWLGDAVTLLEGGDDVALVGASSNPQHINPFFGNGTFPRDHHLSILKYAEASILLVKGAVFAQIGMFDEKFEWAMCEDADLSLRVQQHGQQLAWLPIPHEHWRSSTFNSLPGPVRSSMLEHNRAALFCSWRQSFLSGRIGKYHVFDLWSDGLGDVFCALPHLRAELARMTPAQRAHVVVNTSNPDLMKLLGQPAVRVVSFADPSALRASFEDDGISALQSMRSINYSLPMEMHALVSGALGLPAAGVAEYEDFRRCLRDRKKTDDAPDHLKPGSYCVVHLEFLRSGHHGRAMAALPAQDLLTLCAEMFETVVLIGKERRYTVPAAASGAASIVDLQGKVTPGQLISLLAHAGHFVGIDSYPAHVAQAAGVPSAIFFGSIHPLARIWDERLAWPLLAPLDCIGCYHGHIEPSAPFCMRLDEACGADLGAPAMRDVLRMMIAGRPYDWSAQRVRLRQLQAKMMRFVSHHPAPPDRLFRASPTDNEKVSNMIYQIADQMAALLKDHYQTSHVVALTTLAADLEARNRAKTVELEEAARQRRRYEGELARLRAATRSAPDYAQVTQLAGLAWQNQRCAIDVHEQWLEIVSEDEDPQLFLPAIEGLGGRVHLRLTGTADIDNVLELFWSNVAGEFSEARKRSVGTSGSAFSIDKGFVLAEGESLWIRIDPLAAEGRVRLRGSLSGAFRMASGAAAGANKSASNISVAPVAMTAVSAPMSAGVATTSKKGGPKFRSEHPGRSAGSGVLGWQANDAG